MVMVAAQAQVRVLPLTGCVGAVIEGMDVTRQLDEPEVAFIRRSLLEHGVVFFHRQHLSDAQMERFAAYFAPPMPEPFAPDTGVARAPVSEGNLEPTKRSTSVWHADTTFVTHPPRFTFLRAAKIPPCGGDTCFASMHAAFNALSGPMQAMLEELTAVHSIAPVVARMGGRGEAHVAHSAPVHGREGVHPAVIVHPETGRKALYVSESWVTRIVELAPLEGTAILRMLYEHVKLPEFAVRWRWTVDDVAIWDNRAVQHYAVPDYGDERVMQRVVTEGEAPRGVR
jgi:taurine dioxygenase